MPPKMRLEEGVVKLRSFVRSEQRMPSYQELMVLLNYKSKNGVFGFVRRLKEYGYVRQGEGGRLAWTNKLIGSIRLLGTVAAGFPSPAEEELVDTLSLDEFLVQRPDSTYLLTVSGDSMMDAGIHPGDIVLVEKGATPRAGDIVVAQVDGEWTLKYLRKEKDALVLEPANRRYAAIRPKESLTMGGVVRAVIRKYA